MFISRHLRPDQAAGAPLQQHINVDAALATPAPEVSVSEALSLADKEYGIVGSARRLSGERDQNFLLTTPTGSSFVLKMSHPAELASTINFQTDALMHVARVDPGLPVPKIIRARDGRPEKTLVLDDGERRVVRLTSYLQGRLLSEAVRTVGQRRNVARTLARLDAALAGFHHPSDVHDLLWDIRRASCLRGMLVHIPDAGIRSLAKHCLDDFDREVMPRLGSLRTQVVHNDLNDYNVLVDANDGDRVTGILDFGDMVRTTRINDLAIAASYRITDTDDPLSEAADFVSAYHSVLPIEPSEVDLLFQLMLVRLVMVITISSWRAEQHPDNQAYIMRNNAISCARLERCSAVSRSWAQSVLRYACNMDR
jgi:hydroxylysine kinase